MLLNSLTGNRKAANRKAQSRGRRGIRQNRYSSATSRAARQKDRKNSDRMLADHTYAVCRDMRRRAAAHSTRPKRRRLRRKAAAAMGKTCRK